MKRPLLILSLLLAVVGTLLAGFVLVRKDDNQRLLERTQSELAAAQEDAAHAKAQSAELREIKAENARMKKQIAELSNVRAELAKLKEKSAQPEPAPPAAIAQPTGPQAGNAFRKMLEAPGMREMMKKQQATQVTIAYSGLMTQFGLNDEEKDAFQKLLGDRMAAESELGLKMMDETLTPAQRQEITAQIAAADAASDTTIRDFLNSDSDYQIFKNWQETLPERTEMNMYGRNLFNSSGEPLTPDQEEQLIGLMANARKAPPALNTNTSPQSFDPAALTPDAIKQALEHYDTQAQAVAQGAAAILTPAQLKTLAAMQSQIRSMTEAGLQMSATMFGGKQGK
jgi:hypothetical protein